MTLRGDLAVALVTAFSAGVLVTVWGYDQQEKQKQMQTAEQVRKCNGKGWEYVIRPSGVDCVALQARIELWWPIRDPIKLRRSEIRQAIHSEPKEKS